MALLPDAPFYQNATCPSGVPVEYEHLEPGEVVAAYFLSWHGKKRYTPKHFEKIAPKVTHLMYAFAKPNADGTGEFLHPNFAFGIGSGYEAGEGHFDQLMDIKKAHPHLKILLSVGGGGCDHTFLKLKKKNLLKKYAASCVSMLSSYKHTFGDDDPYPGEKKTFKYKKLFDGIDINWEFSPCGVKADVAQAYLEFVQEMKRLLRAREIKLRRQMVLTATLQISPAVYRGLPIAKVAEYIDWFNVMSYDVYGPSAGAVGHNSPLCGSYGLYTIDGALNRIIHEGVSPSKLVLGLPGYGYKYGQTKGFNKPFNRKSRHTKSLPYKDIKKHYETNKRYEGGWSDRSLVPYLHNKLDDTFISYDTPESFKQKIGLASNKKFAGVMLWALSYDDDDHTLVKTMRDHVGKPFVL